MPDRSDPAWDDLAHRVLRFFELEWPMKPGRWHLQADLYGDIGIYGDDVDELLIAFCEHFGFPKEWVDLRGCFPGEPYAGQPPFQREAVCRVVHLVQAIYQGELPELGIAQSKSQGESHLGVAPVPSVHPALRAREGADRLLALGSQACASGQKPATRPSTRFYLGRGALSLGEPAS